MAWDSEAFRLQSQLRNLLLEDPDTCIQAVAGLRPEEVERLELLVQLGKDFQNQPSSSGLVDAGLAPFPSLREISSLRLSDDGPASFGVPQPTVSTSGFSGDPQDSTVSQGEQEGTVGQDVHGNSNNGPPNPWEGWHPGLLGQAPASSAQRALVFWAQTGRGESHCDRVTCSQVLLVTLLHKHHESRRLLAEPSPGQVTSGISCLQVWMHLKKGHSNSWTGSTVLLSHCTLRWGTMQGFRLYITYLDCTHLGPAASVVCPRPYAVEILAYMGTACFPARPTVAGPVPGL